MFHPIENRYKRGGLNRREFRGCGVKRGEFAESVVNRGFFAERAFSGGRVTIRRSAGRGSNGRDIRADPELAGRGF